MLGVCCRCGAEGPVQRHHPTGRIKGRPLHPWFTFPACPPCNGAQNDLWRQAGLFTDTPTASVLLRRLLLWEDQLPRPMTLAEADGYARVLEDIAARVRTEAA
jgi:hypothetical protein